LCPRPRLLRNSPTRAIHRANRASPTWRRLAFPGRSGARALVIYADAFQSFAARIVAADADRGAPGRAGSPLHASQLAGSMITEVIPQSRDYSFVRTRFNHLLSRPPTEFGARSISQLRCE